MARAHHVARAHRRIAARSRHVAARRAAVRHRVAAKSGHVSARHHVAARHRVPASQRIATRTPLTDSQRVAAALTSTAALRPVRPWLPQPYYGTVIAGVTLGTVVAANTVPPSPSFDLCWYWSDPTRAHGYWDFCR
jgi:hypothetical protein